MTYSYARPSADGVRRAQPHVELLEDRNLLTSASFAAATLIVHSLENEANLVQSLYVNVLGRTPDATGFNGWLGQLQQGVAPEAVEAAFVGSTEFIFDHGNTADGFLTGLYSVVLGRAPDSTGFNAWLTALQNGESPVQVALAFTTSVERRVNLITQEYRVLLNRAPEQAGIDAWLLQYSQGMNNFGLASRLLGSDEFFADQAQNNSFFISAAYRDILNRQPSTPELDAWLNFMATH